MKKRDKRTILTVEWSQNGNSASMSCDVSGPELPKQIRAMLVSHLLRELKPRDYTVEIRDTP